MGKAPRRRQRQDFIEILIGVMGTMLLFVVFAGWPLSGPFVAGATWLHQTVDCAVAGKCAALVDRG